MMNGSSEEQISINWVKLKRWCDLTGDTPDAVHARRKTAKWIDGVHCKVCDGKLWVNISEGQAWVSHGKKKSPVG